MMDPRVEYYAAGVLYWSKSSRKLSFMHDDPQQWRQEDIESDPFAEEGHYLPDDALLSLAYQLLIEMGVANRITDRYGPAMVEIEKDALIFIAENNPGTAFSNTEKYGEKWITRALDNINRQILSGEASVPAEGEWEPLTLDHENPDVDAAIAGIERAITSIRNDNGFSAKFPDVRDGMITEAELALDSIKEKKATRGQIWRSFVSAGRWLADKFGGSALGTTGAELAKWALRLLGLPL